MKVLYVLSLIASCCSFIALALGAWAIDAEVLNYGYIFGCTAVSGVMAVVGRRLYDIWERYQVPAK